MIESVDGIAQIGDIPEGIVEPADTSVVHSEANASKFRKELESLINSQCMENGSDTPDFILAGFLAEQLQVFDKYVNEREKWFGRDRPVQLG